MINANFPYAQTISYSALHEYHATSPITIFLPFVSGCPAISETMDSFTLIWNTC